MSRLDLKGKAVLLTGASSGIGRAAAAAFARRGARLVLAARRADLLAGCAAEARALGAEAVTVTADLSRREDCVRAVEAAVAAFGGIDVLVNNAGINEYRRLSEQDPDRIEAILRTNFLGAAWLTQAALPSLRARSGHVANVASLAGLAGVPGMAAYSASKFALVGFTEALRVELLGTGVTLTAFCPGSTESAMAAAGLEGTRVPRGWLMSAERVAERLVRACERREPEVAIGEVPGWLIRLSRFFPRLADWARWRAFRAARPQSLESPLP